MGPPDLRIERLTSISYYPALTTGVAPVEDALPVQQKDVSAPKDRLKVAYMIYVLLGVGVLYPWNAFLTSLDYFFTLYPDRHIDRMFTVVYFPSNLVLLTICTLLHKKTNLNLRVASGYVLSAIAVCIPIVSNYAILDGSLDGTTLTYFLVLVGASIAGMSDGLGQGAVYADASVLPPLYIQGITVGTALAGIIVLVLRIITKAAFGDTPAGLKRGAMIFYFVAVGVCIACLLLFTMVLHNLPFVKHYRSKVVYALREEDQDEEGVQLALTGQQQQQELGKDVDEDYGAGGKDDNETTMAVYKDTKDQYFQIFKRCWVYFAALFINYTTTLFMFPGVFMGVPPPAALGTWYFVTVAGVFNVADLIGKAFPFKPSLVLKNKWLLLTLAVVRLGFIPLVIWFQILASAWLMLVALFFLALSNGYLTTCLMIQAATGLAPVDQEIATNASVLFMISGLAAGSFLSFLWLLPGMQF